MVSVFARELKDGWIYPCNVEDLRDQLAQMPPQHLEGLHAVGLVPSTNRDMWADARYFHAPKPVIHVYSYPESLRYILPRTARISAPESAFRLQTEFGMRVIKSVGRVVCEWEYDDLRRFVVRFVLVHEIGHHVHYMQRKAAGHAGAVSSVVSEQFADAYACSFLRRAHNEKR